MANDNLTRAKKAKNDEFYTQWEDIEKEVRYYRRHFEGKVVYCNCDDPLTSKFFKYFLLNFERLKLKRLITTCYKNQDPDLFSTNSTKKSIVIKYKIDKEKGLVSYPEYKKAIEGVQKYIGDINNSNTPRPEDIGIGLLEGGGDFRSKECADLLKQADIVVTNPPFSLFREYIAQLTKHDKKFLVIGNMNAITYKEIFPLIKENKIWLGISNGAREYIKPDNTKHKMGNTCWFTNLGHGRRQQKLVLMTMEDNKRFNTEVKKNTTAYQKYDNYDAIEVPVTMGIPSDYKGAMGIPISFLYKYNPEQFEIIGSDYQVKDGLLPQIVNTNWQGKLDRGYLQGKRMYSRILIKHKKP